MLVIPDQSMGRAMAKKMPAKWKKLTKEQEKRIIKDFESRRTRNHILREYQISSDQYCSIIRNTGIKK